MPANWYIPSFATAVITVGLAKGEVVDLKAPPAAEAGDIIGSASEPLAIGVRNVGSVAGSIKLRIRDLDGATIWTGSISLAVDEFGWVYPSPAYTMPNHDLRLRAEAYHDTIVDSYVDETIVIVVEVKTKITLTLEPSTVEPGDTYHYKGRLTRVDTGAGLANMSIITRRYEAEVWVDVGSGTTNTDGYYDITVAAPGTKGYFNCMAAFPGITPFTTSSAKADLGVGMLEPIYILAPAAVGATLVIMSYSR
jgi:hypothetical protein